MLKSKNYNGEEIICEYSSSNLKKSTYNTIHKTLVVEFNSGYKYEYSDIPHEIFAELNLSESTGKYFNQKIAKTFPYKKV